jgi:hypothetical protein
VFWVHPLPSAQSLSLQQIRQDEPQSCGVAAEHTQVPATHVEPGLQTMPQLPQCCGLVHKWVSHPGAGLQSPYSGLQTAAPPTQVAFGPTAIPHAPQCSGLLVSSAQVPPQAVCEGAQVPTHADPSHSSPEAHWIMHALHDAGSEMCDSQPGGDPQSRNPAAHMHDPA